MPGGSLDTNFEEELSAIIHIGPSGGWTALGALLGPRTRSQNGLENGPKRDSFGGYFGIPEGLVLMVLWDSQMDSSGTQESSPAVIR